MIRSTPWLPLLLLLLVAPKAQALNVAVTIKPLHSIAASVMLGVDEPLLLLDGTVSPHIDRIKPSTLRKIRAADLFVWIGPGLESFLAPAAEDLDQTRVLTVGATALPARLTVRDGEGQDAPVDPHLWLDPLNAATVARHLADALASRDKSNADLYRQNAEDFAARMDTLMSATVEQLSPLKDTPFILFHDFIQYFEQRFSLQSAGVITYQPQLTASARHLQSLNRVIEAQGVGCILSEPQFEDRAIRTLSTSSVVTFAIVDPLASAYEADAALYSRWFKDLATTVADCLGGV